MTNLGMQRHNNPNVHTINIALTILENVEKILSFKNLTFSTFDPNERNIIIAKMAITCNIRLNPKKINLK